MHLLSAHWEAEAGAGVGGAGGAGAGESLFKFNLVYTESSRIVRVLYRVHVSKININKKK